MTVTCFHAQSGSSFDVLLCDADRGQRHSRMVMMYPPATEFFRFGSLSVVLLLFLLIASIRAMCHAYKIRKLSACNSSILQEWAWKLEIDCEKSKKIKIPCWIKSPLFYCVTLFLRKSNCNSWQWKATYCFQIEKGTVIRFLTRWHCLAPCSLSISVQ